MTRIRRTTLFLTIALLTSGAGGCEGVKHLVTSFTPTKTASPHVEPRLYPKDAPHGEALDIQIDRLDRKQIRLDNRTPRPYENAVLWINQQYGATLDDIPIGKSGNVSLGVFVNQFSEHFPTGNILEPEKTQPVVLGDLEVGGTIHKLLVRLPKNWQQPIAGAAGTASD